MWWKRKLQIRDKLERHGEAAVSAARNPVYANHQSLGTNVDVEPEKLRDVLAAPVSRLTNSRRLGDGAQDRGEGAALDHGGHPARHHVRSAEPRGGRGSGDLEASRRGHRAAALHLCRPRRGRRRERLSPASAAVMGSRWCGAKPLRNKLSWDKEMSRVVPGLKITGVMMFKELPGLPGFL